MHAMDMTGASTAAGGTSPRHRRSTDNALRFPKKHRDVAHAHARTGMSRIIALRGNLSSGANFLPARTSADGESTVLSRRSHSFVGVVKRAME